ncbi:MAG: thioredoxin family protein [Bacteroidales bacterium]|nr:thioredoxin family protein [Bacteroidales bacterium]
MKKVLFSTLFLLLAFLFTTNSQILQPVKWSFDTKKINNEEFELILKSEMDKGWHIYGTDIPKGGPIPTSFKFNPSEDYELAGKLEMPKAIEKYDNAFEMDLRYFNDNAKFKQRVKMKSDKPFQVTGELEYMSCDDRRCLPPEIVEFSFNLPGIEKTRKEKNKEVRLAEESSSLLKTKEENTPSDPGKSRTESSPTITPIDSKPLVSSSFQETQTLKVRGKEDSISLWTFFFIALGIGFISLLTPCVYPMIPMTVTFFMNASQNKLKARLQALVFGLSIIFIYTVIGVLVSALFGADMIKQVSEHWITNLIFFLLFAFFAISFFGMFELVLPASVTNKSDRHADRGGYVGAFFMALTLVLVSFSCTAPFVGGILVEAATGQVIKPIVGMFGFSLAFGIVFTILAFFPSWLNKMPRSGGWLNSVKVVLAFLILAIGMKYLLVPNQALGWGISREVYIAVWMVLFTLLGFYLLGKIKFTHDSPLEHIAVPRLLLIIASFTFVLYLFPGLFGAPLKAVSGYLPSESSWDLDEIIRESTQNISVVSPGNSNYSGLCDEPKYSDRYDLPYGLKGYFDYEQGLACAKKLNKPVFLDVKGYACTNCKVIEKNVWSDPEVLKRLQNDYVIIALYVDDNHELPENEWVTSTFDGKVKKTIGRKNTDLQITHFGVNAQPYYVLMDNNGNTLTPAIGFEPDINDYISFLDKGIEEFRKLHP